MDIRTLYFCSYRCFSSEWTEVRHDCAITVVIGRNNSGKSQFLEVINGLCNQTPYLQGVKYRCQATLTEQKLQSIFDKTVSGSPTGPLPGNHWAEYGSKLIGADLTWELAGPASPADFEPSSLTCSHAASFPQASELNKKLSSAPSMASHPFRSKTFRRLRADRDIRPEPESRDISLAENGDGATNIIRACLLNASREDSLINTALLHALNDVFATDGKFTQILVKLHDDEDSVPGKGRYEVFFKEEGKPTNVSLTNSGSGLKTVLLVLMHLVVMPTLERKNLQDYIFGFEELENNLHPALFRRLLQFIEATAQQSRCKVFLTTHSSVALDYFGPATDAEILHIKHNGTDAHGRYIEKHFEKLGIISELGAKPSDLLQANGIIWVEGPSDCIYINKLISIYSGNALQEGRDYQCAFYGGALLARVQFVSEDEAEQELVNLFTINSNIIVICDGDRSDGAARIKGRVRRIKQELESLPGSLLWITDAREVENYLTARALQQCTDLKATTIARDPEQYESFYPRKSEPGNSFWEKEIKLAPLDKVDLASEVTQYIELTDCQARFELDQKLKEIVKAIERWKNN